MDRVVVYAGTRNIYEQMYVCLKSLLANNKIDRVFLLIEDDSFPYSIPDNVHPVNVSAQGWFAPGSPNYGSKWSYMTMLRCVFGAMFPNESRILWLDCDTIVNDNISDLFDMNMDGYMYAGAIEPQNCKSVFRYINAGVLLLNLDMIRQFGREQEMVMFLNSYQFAFPDQDVINLLCQGWIRVISSEYNANAFTTACTRPKIYHYAAVKDYQNDWAWKKYEQMPMPGLEEHNESKPVSDV